MDSRPSGLLYGLAAAGIAAILVILYYYGIVAGQNLRIEIDGLINVTAKVNPMVKTLYGVPLLVDRKSMIFIAALLSLPMIPVYLYARRVYSWIQKLRDQTRDFLLAFAGLVETAESYYEALLLAARMVGKPMSTLVEYMARLYRVTGNLEYAFQQAFKHVPRDVRLLLSTITLAAKSGAYVEEVVSQAADYANEFRRFNILIESRLAEYTAIAALSSVTFSFASAVIIKLLNVFTASRPGFIAGALPPLPLIEAAFFYSMLILTVFSSFVVGKVIRGYSLLASKYLVLLVPLNTAIILYLPQLLPGVGGG